jgi:glutathione S-transferase
MKPILHHFEISPFSEKVRLIFGFKKMAWRSVLVPLVLPKPDVVALTGGYRKTPFLQIGADIYCDTALISQVIDRLQPEPPLLPASAPMAPAVAAWADGPLFWQAVMNTQAPEARAKLFEGMTPEAIKALGADRVAMTTGMRRPTAVDAVAQYKTELRQLDRALTNQPWLLGAQPSIADFSAYHGLWFIALAGAAKPLLALHPAVQAWFERVAAFGHGTREEMDSGAAIALAAATKTHAPVQVQAGLGFEAGQAVTVAANDYALESAAGTLVGLTIERVTIARQDPRAGNVHVHFPRAGFQLLKAA